MDPNSRRCCVIHHHGLVHVLRLVGVMSALQALSDALGDEQRRMADPAAESNMTLAEAITLVEAALDEQVAADEQIQALVLAEMGAVMVAMESAGVSCSAVRATARSKLAEGNFHASTLLDDRAELLDRVALADAAAVEAARLAVDWRSETIKWLREHEDELEDIGVTCDCGGWSTTTFGMTVDSLSIALGESSGASS